MAATLNRKGAAKKSLFRRIMRVLTVLVLILSAAVAVAWIGMRDRILGKVLSTLEQQLSGSGLHLKFGTHHLTWRGGVMLEGVELFSDENKDARVAAIRDLQVRIPLMDLVGGESRMIVSTRESVLSLETTAGDLRLEDLEFNFDIDANSLLIERFESRFQGLRVTIDGDLAWQGGDQEELEEIVIPDLSWLINVASWLEFPEGSPTLAISVNPRGALGEGHDYEMVLNGEDFRWETLPLDNARLQVKFAEEAVQLVEMSLQGFGGQLTGDMTFDYGNKQIILSGVKSSMDPFRLIEALPLGESTNSLMRHFRALGGVSVSGDEVVFDLEDFAGSRGGFKVVADEGIGLVFSSKEVVLSKLSANVEFSNGMLAIDASRFSAFGGSGSGRFSLATSGKFHYQAGLDGRGFSAARIGKVFGDGEKYLGTIRLNYAGSGASDPRSHSGKGRVDISGGNYYSIPVFGGLRSFLQSKSKVFGDDIAGNLGMDFQLNHGVVRSSNLRIEGNATKISVAGEVDHVAKTVDLNLQAGLKGIVGTVTGIVGKIFTIHGEGSIGAINWSLAPLSVFDGTPIRDLGDGAASVAGKTGEIVVGVGEAVGKGVKTTVDKTGKFVDKVGGGLKDGARGAFDGIFGKKKEEEKK